MQPGNETFDDLAPLVTRLPVAEAGKVLDVAKPLNLYQAVPDPPLRVRHLTAIGTPAYARLLHPLLVANDRGLSARWRWTKLEVKPITADTTLREALHGASESLSSQNLTANVNVGRLDHFSTTVLASLIREEGLAGPSCYFYFWDGLGIFTGQGPHLYQGPVSAVGCFFPAASRHPQTWSPWGLFQSPTLWWCRDLWFVATHPDATSSYVGGPDSLVDRITDGGLLEALKVSENALVDDWLKPVGRALS
jgi:hypothetical protein